MPKENSRQLQVTIVIAVFFFLPFLFSLLRVFLSLGNDEKE
jgi:TRAP-type mannitol/chloroaromatic compound transport system permease small subunit